MGLAQTQLPLSFCLLGFVSSAQAAESKTGTTANLITTLIQSWQWATFGVLIIAEFFMLLVLFAAFQSLGLYFKNKKKRDQTPDTNNWNVSAAFCWFAILGSFFLVAYYPLYIVQQLFPQLIGVDTITHSIIPYGMVVLTIDMADTTIACAFLALLRRRRYIHFLGSVPMWKTVFDVAIVSSMIALTAAKTTLTCLISTYESESKIMIVNRMYHAFTALYVLIILNIIISAFLLRRALIKGAIQDEVILTNMCLKICPLLGIQAIFRLVYEILVSLPAKEAQHIKYGALDFVDIVIKFLVYMFVLLYGLRVFYPGKPLITFHGSKE